MLFLLKRYIASPPECGLSAVVKVGAASLPVAAGEYMVDLGLAHKKNGRVAQRKLLLREQNAFEAVFRVDILSSSSREDLIM